MHPSVNQFPLPPTGEAEADAHTVPAILSTSLCMEWSCRICGLDVDVKVGMERRRDKSLIASN